MRRPQDWIGTTRETVDPMDPWPAQAMCRMLELDRAEPGAGDPLPGFWHWLYHREAAARSDLGPDGHPAVGGFMPAVVQPRRMWAGGRISFHRPLPLGTLATKRTTIADVAEKIGRAGAMTFVTVRHEISGPAGLAVTEEQDIVYRPDPVPGTPVLDPRPAPTDETLRDEWSCDSTVLFRYSALTYNGHKIHYDLTHAREVEGYPGLVVHGPLLATLLLELVGPVRTFSFRATAPIFADEPFTCCAKPVSGGFSLWVRGQDGRLAMEATAE